MNQPLGLDDFFALEAGEYLDRLSRLAHSPTPPSGDELVRFTRALRGSALMANQPAIARAANALEHLLRGYRDGRLEWEHELPARTQEAVDVLRTLVERVRTWTPDDAGRAERLALDLDRAAGESARPAPAPAPEAGVRAFLARESAALGAALDQTAKGLASGNASEDALAALVRRLQPLRGLAALTDFPPLPDLLDGIERTAVSVSRLELAPAAGAERLAAAADATVRAAREIADRGRPDPNGTEFQRFAALLLQQGAEPDGVPVVDIETLFFAGEAGIVQRGTPPRSEGRAPLAAAAVVSRGEHLVQAADEIAEAASPAQRDLRFHVLLQDLRTLSHGLPTGLEVAVEGFAVAARGAVTRGAAAADAGRFADCIREAGTRLRGYTEVTQPATLATSFDPLVARLDRLGRDVAPPAAVASVSAPQPIPEVPETPVVPVESLAPEPEPVTVPSPAPELPDPWADLPIVPIESLAPDPEPSLVPEPAAPVAVAVVAAVTVDGWDLAASWSHFEALVAGVAVAAPPAAAAPVVPAAPAVVAPAAEPEIVEIDALLYRGRAALERAEAVRRELRALDRQYYSPSTVQPLVDELLDLVELAIAD